MILRRFGRSLLRLAPRLFLFVLISLPVFADQNEGPVPPPQLANDLDEKSILTFLEEPGKGYLEMKGEKKERVEFGPKAGIYGFGLAMESKYFPDPIPKEVGKGWVIQFFLGQRSAQPVISQFASLSLVLPSLPLDEVGLPFGKLGSNRSGAFLLYRSPQSGNALTDEGRLQSQLFANSGTLQVRPILRELASLKQQGAGKLTFERRLFDLNLDASLFTPFSKETASLKGRLELVVYLPKGKAAQQFVANFAKKSFASHP